jgi:hypothetical protein
MIEEKLFYLYIDLIINKKIKNYLFIYIYIYFNQLKQERELFEKST